MLNYCCPFSLALTGFADTASLVAQSPLPGCLLHVLTCLLLFPFPPTADV